MKKRPKRKYQMRKKNSIIKKDQKLKKNQKFQNEPISSKSFKRNRNNKIGEKNAKKY